MDCCGRGGAWVLWVTTLSVARGVYQRTVKSLTCFKLCGKSILAWALSANPFERREVPYEEIFSGGAALSTGRECSSSYLMNTTPVDIHKRFLGKADHSRCLAYPLACQVCSIPRRPAKSANTVCQNMVSELPLRNSPRGGI